MITLGSTIKKYRRIKGVKSKEFSILLGKSESYISHLENGRYKNPDYESVKQILDKLEVPEGEKVLLLEKVLDEPINEIKVTKVKTNFMKQSELDILMFNIRKDAEMIAEELLNLNIETKKILIELLNKQLQ